mmetsp:Transcript_64/g.206  ORF Transcript_64/g.206 Transcript_64/m.206 type:complete len:507 (+) Transcript_64:176-1696(+)|eukprot:scaffold3551_cov408-Prasinococcus_capsulatus_cf.AAC.28
MAAPSADEVGLSLPEAVHKNVPVKLPQHVKDWPAISAWGKGEASRLRLKSLAGSAKVDVMVVGGTGPLVFNGDIRRRESTMVAFSDVVDYAWGKANFLAASGGVGRSSAHSANDVERAIYLAQAPIYKADHGHAPLEALKQDISVPYDAGSNLSSVNLWMSLSKPSTVPSRSSPHYDPYHNLLCVVRGRKVVTLHSPEQTALMRPQPVSSDGSNHPCEDFQQQSLGGIPYSVVALEPGDALFIPEGWWHQVDSYGLCLAVNTWWESVFSTTYVDTHMASFYCRQIMTSLVEREKASLIARIKPYEMNASLAVDEAAKIRWPRTVSSHCQAWEKVILALLPSEQQLLYDWFFTEERDGKDVGEGMDEMCLKALMSRTWSFRRIFKALSLGAPRLLESWLLNSDLSPSCIYMITTALEAPVDGKEHEHDRSEGNDAAAPSRKRLKGDTALDSIDLRVDDDTFFRCFYAAFHSPQSVVKLFVDGREEFSQLALTNVLRHTFGVAEKWPK